MAFIDSNRGEYGVEPICAILPIAPSTYYEAWVVSGSTCARTARWRMTWRTSPTSLETICNNNRLHSALDYRSP